MPFLLLCHSQNWGKPQKNYLFYYLTKYYFMWKFFTKQEPQNFLKIPKISAFSALYKQKWTREN